MKASSQFSVAGFKSIMVNFARICKQPVRTVMITGSSPAVKTEN
jgi:hypothetical protein